MELEERTAITVKTLALISQTMCNDTYAIWVTGAAAAVVAWSSVDCQWRKSKMVVVPTRRTHDRRCENVSN